MRKVTTFRVNLVQLVTSITILLVASISFISNFDSAVAQSLTPISTFHDCANGCPEMVTIGPGSFQMGPAVGEQERENIKPFERTFSIPRHLVTIGRKFALAKYPVTRMEFTIFEHESGYKPSKQGAAAVECDAFYSGDAPRLAGLNWRNPGYAQTGRDPVVCVSWDDAQAYVSWLTHKTHHVYRLPTEAEWEYAARAGTSTARYWGDNLKDACRYANVRDVTFLETLKIPPNDGNNFDCTDGYAYTSPVGSFLPNRFGLYDMLGNVLQLTADCWNESYRGAPSNGTAWLLGDCVTRVTRGGSAGWVPMFVRASYRSHIPVFMRSADTGFRVARDF